MFAYTELAENILYCKNWFDGITFPTIYKGKHACFSFALIAVDHHETYENIAPNEDYDIQGWYTVKTLKNEKSEIASTTEKTKPGYIGYLLCLYPMDRLWPTITSI